MMTAVHSPMHDANFVNRAVTGRTELHHCHHVIPPVVSNIRGRPKLLMSRLPPGVSGERVEPRRSPSAISRA
jgi:hypothetical protein